jgi:hypothetical protein
MHEQTLRDFMAGTGTVAELRSDLEHAIVERGHGSYEHPIVPMVDAFELTPEHLVRLCDAVLAGELPPESLEPIGFCLIASDRFDWEDGAGRGALVDTLNDWSSPQINYPLNSSTVAKFRHRLLTGEDTFTRADTEDASA